MLGRYIYVYYKNNNLFFSFFSFFALVRYSFSFGYLFSLFFFSQSFYFFHSKNRIKRTTRELKNVYIISARQNKKKKLTTTQKWLFNSIQGAFEWVNFVCCFHLFFSALPICHSLGVFRFECVNVGEYVSVCMDTGRFQYTLMM